MFVFVYDYEREETSSLQYTGRALCSQQGVVACLSQQTDRQTDRQTVVASVAENTVTARWNRSD